MSLSGIFASCTYDSNCRPAECTTSVCCYDYSCNSDSNCVVIKRDYDSNCDRCDTTNFITNQNYCVDSYGGAVNYFSRYYCDSNSCRDYNNNIYVTATPTQPYFGPEFAPSTGTLCTLKTDSNQYCYYKKSDDYASCSNLVGKDEYFVRQLSINGVFNKNFCPAQGSVYLNDNPSGIVTAKYCDSNGNVQAARSGNWINAGYPSSSLYCYYGSCSGLCDSNDGCKVSKDNDPDAKAGGTLKYYIGGGGLSSVSRVLGLDTNLDMLYTLKCDSNGWSVKDSNSVVYNTACGCSSDKNHNCINNGICVVDSNCYGSVAITADTSTNAYKFDLRYPGRSFIYNYPFTCNCDSNNCKSGYCTNGNNYFRNVTCTPAGWEGDACNFEITDFKLFDQSGNYLDTNSNANAFSLINDREALFAKFSVKQKDGVCSYTPNFKVNFFDTAEAYYKNGVFGNCEILSETGINDGKFSSRGVTSSLWSTNIKDSTADYTNCFTQKPRDKYLFEKFVWNNIPKESEYSLLHLDSNYFIGPGSQTTCISKLTSPNPTITYSFDVAASDQYFVLVERIYDSNNDYYSQTIDTNDLNVKITEHDTNYACVTNADCTLLDGYYAGNPGNYQSIYGTTTCTNGLCEIQTSISTSGGTSACDIYCPAGTCDASNPLLARVIKLYSGGLCKYSWGRQSFNYLDTNIKISKTEFPEKALLGPYTLGNGNKLDVAVEFLDYKNSYLKSVELVRLEEITFLCRLNYPAYSNCDCDEDSNANICSAVEWHGINNVRHYDSAASYFSKYCYSSSDVWTCAATSPYSASVDSNCAEYRYGKLYDSVPIKRTISANHECCYSSSFPYLSSCSGGTGVPVSATVDTNLYLSTPYISSLGSHSWCEFDTNADPDCYVSCDTDKDTNSLQMCPCDFDNTSLTERKASLGKTGKNLFVKLQMLDEAGNEILSSEIRNTNIESKKIVFDNLNAVYDLTDSNYRALTTNEKFTVTGKLYFENSDGTRSSIDPAKTKVYCDFVNSYNPKIIYLSLLDTNTLKNFGIPLRSTSPEAISLPSAASAPFQSIETLEQQLHARQALQIIKCRQFP